MTEDFCQSCKSSSDDISAGDVLSVNFIGRYFLGSTNRCPHCDSTERNLYFSMFVPILPLGTWKVKRVGRSRILTRKLSAGSIPDFGRKVYTEQERQWRKKLIVRGLVFLLAINILIRLVMWLLPH